MVIRFGSKYSLIGFHNHQGEFVTVSHRRSTGFYHRDGVVIPTRDGKTDEPGSNAIEDRFHAKNLHATIL